MIENPTADCLEGRKMAAVKRVTDGECSEGSF